MLIIYIAFLILTIFLAAKAEEKANVVVKECGKGAIKGIFQIDESNSGMKFLFLKDIDIIIKSVKRLADNNKNRILEILKHAKCAFRVFYAFSIVHILVCGYLALKVYTDREKWNSDVMAIRIAIIFMDVLMCYCLYLTPYFEFKRQKRLAQIGPDLFELVNSFCEYFVKMILKVGAIIIEFSVSFFAIDLLIRWMRGNNFIDDFITVLLILLIYQYILLKLIARGIFVCFKGVSKNGFIQRKLVTVKTYFDDVTTEKIYIRLKSTTFICFIVVNAMAYSLEKASHPLYSALGILFLLDTYIAERFNKK